VLLITHDRDVAAHADRIIEIKDGSITADSGGGEPKPRSQVAWGGTAAVVDAPWAGSTSQNRSHSASPLTGGFEALRMAVRSLKANLLRTVLTLLGIVIGVGSVIAMLAIGEGAAQQVVDRIGRMGSNLLVVRAGTPSQRGPRSGATTLMLADVDELKRVDNVLAAVPESQGNVTVRYGSLDVRTQVTATSPDYPLTRDWPVARGVFFEDEDLDNYATVAVLGQTVVNNMFPDGEDPIGRYVLLDNVPFLVIGVMSSKGATQFGQDSDDVLFVPVTTGGLRLFGQRYLRSVTVAVKDLGLIDGTQEKVTDLLAGRHGQQDFQITNMVSLIETVSATQNTLTALLGSIAAISLLVGGIGVMNIMLVSVTERTREIGIRMATGARTRDVLRQFLTEATVVCAMGGMIGVLIGLATGYALTRFGMPVKFTASPMILAFCCAVATGVVFGFAPALKAARLDPVVALSSK
jgi:macrolide transport system ATP-binding/permease protein